MWHDLLVALSLVMVIEGLLPVLSPRGMRRTWEQMSRLDDRTLRLVGLVSMVAGAVALHVLH
jgi:uncharacterized protein YjeT (DUF2065 family)